MTTTDVRARFEAALPDGWEFDPRELALLATAQKIAERIDALEVELSSSGIMVTGSQGQPRLNPLVAEIRLQQTALARVLGGVGVPSDEPVKSARHVQAARRRWDREGS